MRRAALLILLASGCDRCRGEQVPITPRPAYDARPPPNPDAPPAWSKAASLLAPEVGPRVRGIALPFGRVLVWKSEPEIFDTHGGAWKKTTARPPCAASPGGWERLARIPDEIVFAIGATCGYDAERDAWVPVPHFDVRGQGWAVTQLAKGDLLVTGSGEASSPGKQAFRWDAETKEISSSSLLEPRTGHDAVRLLDDTILITGSSAGAHLEQFTPSTSTFHLLGAQEYAGAATLLDDGRVIFVAPHGCGLYDPSSATWLGCAAMSVPRVPGTFTMTAIAGDRLLVAGGRTEKDPSRVSDLAEVYDPHDDAWTDVTSMPVARAEHLAVPLLDGRVVIVGGQGDRGPVADAFFYTPEPEPAASIMPSLDDASISD